MPVKPPGLGVCHLTYPGSRRTPRDGRDHGNTAGGASGQAGFRELDYEEVAPRRGVVSDVWLNSANFYPAD